MNTSHQDDLTLAARDCLEHLQVEEQALAEMLEALQALRQILMKGTSEELMEALEARESIEQELQQMRQLRLELQQRLSVMVHGDQNATIHVSELENRVPINIATPLAETRQRIHHLVHAVDKVTRANGHLIRARHELIQRTLDAISGEPESSTVTYGSSGKMNPRTNRSIFQTKC